MSIYDSNSPSGSSHSFLWFLNISHFLWTGSPGRERAARIFRRQRFIWRSRTQRRVGLDRSSGKVACCNSLPRAEGLFHPFAHVCRILYIKVSVWQPLLTREIILFWVVGKWLLQVDDICCEAEKPKSWQHRSQSVSTWKSPVAGKNVYSRIILVIMIDDIGCKEVFGAGWLLAGCLLFTWKISICLQTCDNYSLSHSETWKSCNTTWRSRNLTFKVKIELSEMCWLQQ